VARSVPRSRNLKYEAMASTDQEPSATLLRPLAVPRTDPRRDQRGS
jgi:hypothetical protein